MEIEICLGSSLGIDFCHVVNCYFMVSQMDPKVRVKVYNYCTTSSSGLSSN